jgi:predicted pyridoxine 5'-phosphate oxidase superfamily flavin-nucleotide-binding protein
MRQLQDRCDTRLLADRLDEKLDCSYKGGAPGFVRVTADDELAFPSYDGNGMFRSLGNVLVNPSVALLFIDFERPSRLRVNGAARVVESDPLLASHPGAQFIVRVHAARIFPNCPRYIHRMTIAEPSPYVPRADYTPPIPKWKRFDDFADVLARDDPARSTPR